MNERHDKLTGLLWRTLDRLERSLEDRRIEPAQAREVIAVISELTHALPGPDPDEDRRVRRSAVSLIESSPLLTRL